MASTMDGTPLTACERTNYFFGRLLTVEDFEREQRYGNHKRLLLNRLVAGCGVVCGLDLVADGTSVRITPGLALDAWGREIVVPEAVIVDPRRLTDGSGQPSGEVLDRGAVTISLIYAETPIDLVPDPSGGVVPSVIREGCDVLVRPTDEQDATGDGCADEEFPVAAGAQHELVASRGNRSCAELPANARVRLGRVELRRSGNVAIDSHTGRDLLYGNDRLSELIVRLSDRVEEIAGARVLRYLAGDGQSGLAGAVLPIALAVEVVDFGGAGVRGVPVHFSVTAGGGSVGKPMVETRQTGRAQTTWKLGSRGRQAVIASAAGSAFRVAFTARVVRPTREPIGGEGAIP